MKTRIIFRRPFAGILCVFWSFAPASGVAFPAHLDPARVLAGPRIAARIDDGARVAATAAPRVRPQEEPPATPVDPLATPSPIRDSDVVVTIDGRPYTHAELLAWIGDSGLAFTHRKEFVRDRLVRARCAERGITIDPAASLRHAEEELRNVIEVRHRGDRESFLRELAEGGFTWDTYLEMRRARLEVEDLLERLAIAEGVGRDESAIQREFDALYGRTSMAPRLHVLSFGVPVVERESGRDFAVEEEIRAVAESLAGRLRDVEEPAGAIEDALAEARDRLAASSIPAVASGTPPRHELVPRYGRESRGRSFDSIVRAMRPGELRGPVFFEGGYVVVWCESVDPVVLGDVRDELLARVSGRPPDAIAMREFGFRLLSEAKIEY